MCLRVQELSDVSSLGVGLLVVVHVLVWACRTGLKSDRATVLLTAEPSFQPWK